MTPEEVVDRARELDDCEVLLTIRGIVTEGPDGIHLSRLGLLHDVTICDRNGRPERDLVKIRRAPVKVESGELYEAPGLSLSRGQADGSLHLLDKNEFIEPGRVREIAGLRRVKVVKA